jgi:hypothetical protein
MHNAAGKYNCMQSTQAAIGNGSSLLSARNKQHSFEVRAMSLKPGRRPLHAGIWAKAELGFYVEPQWCSERLFAVEEFAGSVWDPAVGIGRVAEAARHAGYITHATDIADRGYEHFDGCVDFLRCDQSRANNIVCNPPFDHCDRFVHQALALTNGKIAMIWLARRLNAARWLAETPLARVYLLTPRPSMPPGQVILAGEKPGGGTQDFVWLVWERGHNGPPELHWLRRQPWRQPISQPSRPEDRILPPHLRQQTHGIDLHPAGGKPGHD